jgi:hypothetical protein
VDAAGAVGQPGGDGDDPGADAGRAGGGVAGPGEVSGGPGEVVRDRGAGQPGVVGGETAGRQMREGPGDQIGVDLFKERSSLHR